VRVLPLGMQEVDISKKAPQQKRIKGASQEVPKRFSDVGTPDYIAPEVLLGSGHSFQVDWWAMGCILFEFLIGYPPFTGGTLGEVFQHVTSRDIQWPEVLGEEYYQEMPHEARDLINALLVLDPKKRLGHGDDGVEEAKAHLFFGLEGPTDWANLRDAESVWVPDPASSMDTRYFASAEDYAGMAEAAGKELVEDTQESMSMSRSDGLSGLDLLDMAQDDFSFGDQQDPLECSAFLNFSSKNLAALRELTIRDAKQTLRACTPKSSTESSVGATSPQLPIRGEEAAPASRSAIQAHLDRMDELARTPRP